MHGCHTQRVFPLVQIGEVVWQAVTLTQSSRYAQMAPPILHSVMHTVLRAEPDAAALSLYNMSHLIAQYIRA